MIQPGTTAERNYSIHSIDTFTIGREVGKVINEVNRLRRPSAGHNGYDAVPVPPNGDAIDRAVEWIKDMHYDALATGEEWLKPHISTDEDGDIAFEWWKDDKKLTVYVSPETAEYIKVERPAATSDLMDGRAETSEDRHALWRWLTS